MTIDVAVIGGGPAGLAAARPLAAAGLEVSVFERAARPGGRAAAYGCKAAPSCSGCNLCLLSDLLSAPQDFELRTLTEVVGLGRAGDGFELEVLERRGAERRTTVQARAVVLATGFEPFSLSKRPQYLRGRPEGLVSAADLESMVREGRLPEVCRPEGRLRVAFVQCAGSRNEREGAGYCSRVCCPNALRLAHRLVWERPGSEATIFYIDLQVPDRARRGLLAEALADPAVRLHRGLPSEILPAPGGGPGYLVRAERLDEGGLTEEVYDLVVFSVGMRPGPGSVLARRLGLEPNRYGFLSGSVPGVFVAGACAGPVDIGEAITAGLAAAGEALLFFGEELGREPGRATPRDRNEAATRALEALGRIPVFQVETGGLGGPARETGGPEETLPVRRPPGEPSAIILDATGPEPLAVHRRAMELAAAERCYVFARDFRVSGPGLEELYRRARLAGSVFVRYRRPPRVEGATDDSGTRRVRFEEPGLGPGGSPLDVAVTVGRVLTGRDFGAGLDSAAAVPDSPRLPAPLTFVRGRYVLGPGRGADFGDEELSRDALAALAQARLDAAFLLPAGSGSRGAAVEPVAERTGACASCLTCLRWCPHGAVSLSGGRPVVDPGLCRGCGLCVSVCPARAMTWSAGRSADGRPADGREPPVVETAKTGRTGETQLVVLACSNSAARVAAAIGESAERARAGSGYRLVEVPCAGSVTEGDILAAIAAGAAGVTVVACPEGACAHQRGHLAAKAAVQRCQDLLEAAGLPREVVRFDRLGPADLGGFGRVLGAAFAAGARAGRTGGDGDA